MCWHALIMRCGFARVNSTTTLESFVVLEYCLASGLNREQRFHRRSALARIHVPDDLPLLGSRQALPEIVGEIDVRPARLVRVVPDAKADAVDYADGEADRIAGQLGGVVNVLECLELIALHEIAALHQSALDGDRRRKCRWIIVAVGAKTHSRQIARPFGAIRRAGQLSIFGFRNGGLRTHRSTVSRGRPLGNGHGDRHAVECFLSGAGEFGEQLIDGHLDDWRKRVGKLLLIYDIHQKAFLAWGSSAVLDFRPGIPPMNKILQYLGFALEIAEVIPSIVALVTSGNLSAASLQAAINPLVAQLQATFTVTIPTALVEDVIAAAADAIIAFGKK